MQPGDTIALTVFRRTAAGLPATGKASNFTIRAWLDGAAVSLTAAVAEIGAAGPDGQAYSVTVTLPATRGQFALRATATTPGTDLIWPDQVGELENNDLDSLYGVIAVPVVAIVSAGGPQGDIQIRLVESDYAPVSFTVKDQANVGIDLSGYNNAHFRVWNKLQSGSAYDQTATITMTAAGLVTIGVPETASFYADFGPDPTASSDQVTLYWQFTADEASNTAKTRTLARGTMTIVRKES